MISYSSVSGTAQVIQNDANRYSVILNNFVGEISISSDIYQLKFILFGNSIVFNDINVYSESKLDWITIVGQGFCEFESLHATSIDIRSNIIAKSISGNTVKLNSASIEDKLGDGYFIEATGHLWIIDSKLDCTLHMYGITSPFVVIDNSSINITLTNFRSIGGSTFISPSTLGASLDYTSTDYIHISPVLEDTVFVEYLVEKPDPQLWIKTGNSYDPDRWYYIKDYLSEMAYPPGSYHGESIYEDDDFGYEESYEFINSDLSTKRAYFSFAVKHYDIQYDWELRYVYEDLDAVPIKSDNPIDIEHCKDIIDTETSFICNAKVIDDLGNPKTFVQYVDKSGEDIDIISRRVLIGEGPASIASSKDIKIEESGYTHPNLHRRINVFEEGSSDNPEQPYPESKPRTYEVGIYNLESNRTTTTYNPEIIENIDRSGIISYIEIP